MDSEHSDIKYKCPLCDYQATRKGALKVHINSVHNAIKYKCLQCDYQDITRDVYALRLRGAENLEEYHLERGMEEMKKLAKDKQNLPELHKRKNDGDDEVELAHKRQKSEREEQVRATREAQISSHLCKGVLKSIHKDAKTVEKSPLVQLIAKEVTDGALTTLTLSDGQNFSSNVEPLNEELAEELNNIPMFDLIKIDCAMVRGTESS